MGNITLTFTGALQDRNAAEARVMSARRRVSGIDGLLDELNLSAKKGKKLRLDMREYAAIEGARIISEMREGANLSQRQLASLLKVQQQRISHMESARSKRGATLGQLFEIAEACGYVLNISFARKKGLRKLDDQEVIPLQKAKKVVDGSPNKRQSIR